MTSHCLWALERVTDGAEDEFASEERIAISHEEPLSEC